jgi:hypothetical protein
MKEMKMMRERNCERWRKSENTISNYIKSERKEKEEKIALNSRSK